MFKVKIKSISGKFLLCLALVLLITSQSISLVHKISHDGALVSGKENIFAKIFFPHSTEQSSKTGLADNCALCSVSNFHKQILFNVSLIFLGTIFYLTFFTRIFSRVKLSYILSSKASRAPPES